MQLIKLAGYSRDLGQAFINILPAPVTAVSSLIANWRDRPIGLMVFIFQVYTLHATFLQKI